MRDFDDQNGGLPKEHISVSQMRLYMKCPEAYRRRYLCGDKIAPSGALVLGKAQHASQEANYRQKVESQADVPVEAVRDAYSDAFDVFAQEAEWGEDKPGQAKDWGIQAAELYHGVVAPRVQPVAVEQELRVRLECGVTLLGYADVIQADGTVRDTKVIGKRISQAATDKDLQLTAYAYALAMQGREPPSLVFDMVVKNKVPVVESTPTTRHSGHYADFEYIAAKTVDAITAGVFPPNVDSFICSPTGCGYWQTCPARRAGRAVLVS